jgi:hypothetical protein
MGRRKHGEPDPFRTDGFPIDERPASDDEATAAVNRFVTPFVLEPKRERIRAGLLHPKQQRRIESIHHAYKWIAPAVQTELEGNTGFPQHLHARFGDLRGVMIDERAARHVTAAGAAVLASGQFGAIFVADGASLALLFPETGCPTLCMR